MSAGESSPAKVLSDQSTRRGLSFEALTGRLKRGRRIYLFATLSIYIIVTITSRRDFTSRRVRERCRRPRSETSGHSPHGIQPRSRSLFDTSDRPCEHRHGNESLLRVVDNQDRQRRDGNVRSAKNFRWDRVDRESAGYSRARTGQTPKR